MVYPRLEMNLSAIRHNASRIGSLCRSNGIEPVAVIKGFNAQREIVEALLEAGYRCLASSRLPHLRALRTLGRPVETMCVRIPMLSETEEVVRCCDASLNSELETIAALDRAAFDHGVIHRVILMRDLGDLREGIFDAERFIETAGEVERRFSHIRLYGIGANLSCYGTVRPTVHNLSELAANADEIERRIGRPLDVVSGGASSSVPLVVRKTMPQRINQLRIGGGLMFRSELFGLRESELTELTDDTLALAAEIVELGEKPTHPVGELDRDCFGNYKTFEDRGVRKRAIVAVGAFDIGDCSKLTPLDPGAKILGCSSDHMIVDIQDSREAYRMGDVMKFRLEYQSMLYVTANPLVEKAAV